jgi:hypothetical protein
MTELIAAAVKELISQDTLHFKAFEWTGRLLCLHAADVGDAKVKPQGLKLPYKIPACYQSPINRGSSSASNARSNPSYVPPASSIEENSNDDISPADTITGLVMDESSDAHAVAIQTILHFIGAYNEEDIYLLVLEEYLLHVENV